MLFCRAGEGEVSLAFLGGFDGVLDPGMDCFVGAAMVFDRRFCALVRVGDLLGFFFMGLFPT